MQSALLTFVSSVNKENSIAPGHAADGSVGFAKGLPLRIPLNRSQDQCAQPVKLGAGLFGCFFCLFFVFVYVGFHFLCLITFGAIHFALSILVMASFPHELLEKFPLILHFLQFQVSISPDNDLFFAGLVLGQCDQTLVEVVVLQN